MGGAAKSPDTAPLLVAFHGQTNNHVQPIAGQTATRPVVWDLVRPFAVELGVGGIS